MDCCAWTVDTWVPMYTTLTVVSVVWVVSMALEMRLYVIGGTMCQWYFAPAGTTDFSAGKTSLTLTHSLSFVDSLSSKARTEVHNTCCTRAIYTVTRHWWCGMKKVKKTS